MKNAGVILHTHVTITAISPQWRLSSVPHVALSLVALITRRQPDRHLPGFSLSPHPSLHPHPHFDGLNSNEFKVRSGIHSLYISLTFFSFPLLLKRINACSLVKFKAVTAMFRNTINSLSDLLRITVVSQVSLLKVVSPQL